MLWVKNPVRRSLQTLFALSLVGCEGLGWQCANRVTNPLPVPPEPLLPPFVVASPPDIQVLPGGTASTTISAQLDARLRPATLSITGPVPSGVTATFTPAVVGNNQPAQLTIAALPTAALTSDVLTVNVAATDGLNRVNSSVLVPVRVVPPFRLERIAPQSVTAGSALDIPVLLSRAQGVTSPVTFSVDGATLPLGISASWSPPVSSGTTTTLRFDVAAASPPATHILKVIATAPTFADTTLMALTVSAASLPSDFTITSTPTAATVAPGANASFNLALSRSGPPVGNIALAASGLPSGATPTFTPAAASGTSSQLVITTTAATPDGTYPVVISGTAGALVRQTTVSLTVATPPDFALTVSPATLTIAQGATGQVTASIQRTGAPGAVVIDLAGLPAGVTAVPNPASVTGASSVITFAVTAAAVPGTYPLTVRGIAGALTRSAPLSLTIPPPPASNVVVQLGSSAVTIGPRGTAQIPVRLTRTGNAVGRLLELRVAGFPPGGIAWVSPNFVTGDTATLQIVGGTPGTAVTTVTAVLGATNPSASVNVTVSGATTPDFSLLPTPREFNIVRSSPFTPFTLSILRANGFAGNVALTVITDQPGAYAVNLTPTSTTSDNVQGEIYVSELVSPGYHVVTIQGTSGGITRTALMTVFVR